MIAVEMLEMVSGRYLRCASTMGMIMPRPDTFDEFVRAAAKQSVRVTDAPELDGKVPNQKTGRPIRMVSLGERTGVGVGRAVDYGLVWVNPVGITMAPEVSRLSEEECFPVEYPQGYEISVDWDRPGQLHVSVPSLSRILEVQQAGAFGKRRRV